MLQAPRPLQLPLLMKTLPLLTLLPLLTAVLPLFTTAPPPPPDVPGTPGGQHPRQSMLISSWLYHALVAELGVVIETPTNRWSAHLDCALCTAQRSFGLLLLWRHFSATAGTRRNTLRSILAMADEAGGASSIHQGGERPKRWA